MGKHHASEPRFRIAHLFQDEALRSVFRSAELTAPELPALPESPLPAPPTDLNSSVLVSVSDKFLSDLRYKQLNGGVMTKEDRQAIRAFKKLRAVAMEVAAGKDVRSKEHRAVASFLSMVDRLRPA
jgi:hypothetical protein